MKMTKTHFDTLQVLIAGLRNNTQMHRCTIATVILRANAVKDLNKRIVGTYSITQPAMNEPLGTN